MIGLVNVAFYFQTKYFTDSEPMGVASGARRASSTRQHFTTRFWGNQMNSAKEDRIAVDNRHYRNLSSNSR